ncbi:hypothetical protein ACOME3_002812 [Neoechinorhynchus agilis]
MIFQTAENHERIAQLVKEVGIHIDISIRIQKLTEAQNLIMRMSPSLLDNFLDEILIYQNDRNSAMRRAVVAFIEEACKCDTEVLIRVVENFQPLLYDPDISVVKKSICVGRYIYRLGLKWIAKMRHIPDLVKNAWNKLQGIKEYILSLINSSDPGVRICVIKFMEMICVVQSQSSKNDLNDGSMYLGIGPIPLNLFCLDHISSEHGLLCKKDLALEGKAIFNRLIAFSQLDSITPLNLIVCVETICNITLNHPDTRTNHDHNRRGRNICAISY